MFFRGTAGGGMVILPIMRKNERKTSGAALRWRALGRGVLADPRRGDIGLYAANGTYYLFLSLGPLTALLLALLPYTPLTESALTEGVLSFVPAAFRRLMQGVVRDVYAGSRAALGVSLVLELWSAARFLASVDRSVAALTGGGAPGYLQRRLLGAAYTAAMVILLLGDLMLLWFGERLLLAVRQRAPAWEGLWSALVRLRAVLLFAGLTAGNALLFRYIPRRTRRWGQLLPGAVLSAAAWLAFSRLYSWSMERFGLFGVYGSIAAAAASLVWMYGSLYILFLGAWLSDVDDIVNNRYILNKNN